VNKDFKIDPENLIDFLEAIEDPRIDRKKKHELIDILIIAICAAICGATNWVEVEEFGKAKLSWFSNFLNLKHAIPSHDTFRRVFILLDPEQFRDAFIGWVKVVTQDKDLKQICIDGKALRRSFERGKSNSAIHMLNAWSTGVSLSLGHMKVDGKSNEITAMPKLLELLNVKGHIVSADAIHCQVKTANKILEQEGNYLLGLKGNQGYLEDRVKERFHQKSGAGSRSCLSDSYQTNEKSHGRIEKRKCKVLTPKEGKSFGINPLNKWPELNSIIEIENERTDLKTGEISKETRYYISSLVTSAEEFLEAVRGHWQVENKLHWVLDVVFREDDCRSRTGFSAENFSMLRQFALNLIRLNPSKKSIKVKQKVAGWDEEFLLSVLLNSEI
jgi:predicted transposase YbfD/YdcC